MLGLDRRLIQNFDWVLSVVVIALVGTGLVNLVSSSHGDAGLPEELRRQLISLALGVSALAVVVFIDYRHYERLALPLYLGSIGLLALTLVIAPMTRGSQSWLLQGRLQPAELAKIGMILMLARHFQRGIEKHGRERRRHGASRSLFQTIATFVRSCTQNPPSSLPLISSFALPSGCGWPMYCSASVTCGLPSRARSRTSAR